MHILNTKMKEENMIYNEMKGKKEILYFLYVSFKLISQKKTFLR